MVPFIHLPFFIRYHESLLLLGVCVERGDFSLPNFGVVGLSVSSQPPSLTAVKIINVFSDKTMLYV